jgi:signal peptidase I
MGEENIAIRFIIARKGRSEVQHLPDLDNSKTPETPGLNPAEPAANRQGFVWQMWTRDLLVSVVVAFFIITFLYQPVRVEGTSMMPELQDQERIFINKFEYHFEPIQRGDVIVFHYPRDPVKSYIKRVIAVPGDELRIDNGQVYVNGKALAEPYVPLRFEDQRSYPDTVLRADQYFVMGDHRRISSDSRDFGPVDRDLIYGKAAFVYWPTDDMGVVR